MAHDPPGPDRDRLLAARVMSIAYRHARWGAMTETQRAAGVTALREAAVGRGDLLAETAGLALGTAEGKGAEYAARARAVADLCRLAGADEDLVPGWAEEGRRRAEAASLPPFSQPGRRTPWRH